MTCSYETARIAEDRDRLAHNPEVAGSNPVSPTRVMSRDIVGRCPETSLAFRACFRVSFRI
jgi:hypothetical protein